MGVKADPPNFVRMRRAVYGWKRASDEKKTAKEIGLTTTELLPHERFRASSFFRHFAFGIRRRSKNWPLNP
jgi:hypothetical protein